MIRTRGRGFITTLAAVALALLVAGCTTTQSPGRQLNDNTIHAAVSTKLTGARFSNILNIDINVTNGVVTLAGEVPNAQVKAEAEREVRSVSGVVDVKNNLQVKAPRPSAAPLPVPGRAACRFGSFFSLHLVPRRLPSLRDGTNIPLSQKLISQIIVSFLKSWRV
jgi:BON domain